MDEPGRGSTAAIEFPSDATLTRSVVGFVKARDVHLTGSGAGFVAADGNFSILNGGCGPVLANGSVTIRNGGCGPLVANGDVSIENGGTQLVVASGGARVGPRAFVESSSLRASPSRKAAGSWRAHRWRSLWAPASASRSRCSRASSDGGRARDG